MVIGTGPVHPGIRPRRPPRPRKPRETFWRTEVVWSSEDDDILLADLLHLIPSGVKAHRVRVNVERNPMNGYPYVIITFNHELPNLRFKDQMRGYEKRIQKYETELERWTLRDAEWCAASALYENQVSELKEQLERVFDEHLESVV